jgi:hypothetical protein
MQDAGLGASVNRGRCGVVFDCSCEELVNQKTGSRIYAKRTTSVVLYTPVRFIIVLYSKILLGHCLF